MADQRGFRRDHEALSRARWESRKAACWLLRRLLATLWTDGEVVIAIDDTIERRWGANIKARGIYLDPGALVAIVDLQQDLAFRERP